MKQSLRRSLYVLFICITSLYNLNAQVTIGANTPPLPVSVLELISPTGTGGLRLPQLNSSQIHNMKDAINQLDGATKQRANGLVIYNIDSNCAMYWNGADFASLCGEIPAQVSVNCSSFTPNGLSIRGKELDYATNYITLSLTSTSPGPYSISLSGNGMTFSGEGQFITGSETSPSTQTVTLYGSGIPIEDGVHNLTLHDNLSATTLCSIPMITGYPTMKVLGLGEGVYQPATASNDGSSRTFLQSAPRSFGMLEESVVHINGFSLTNGGTSTGTTLQGLLTGNNKPDIVIIGYNYSPGSQAVGYLKTFVDQGGVIIQASQNSSSAGLANSIFGTSAFVSSAYGSQYMHPILNPTPATQDDPIFYGPFSGSTGMTGKSWGEDVNDGWSFSAYPAGDENLLIYSTYPGNSSRISCLRHKTLGYFFIGDGGFLAGSDSNTSTDTWPFKLNTTTRLPMGKNYNGGVVAYNSELFGNIMAWAIEYAYQKSYAPAP